MASKFDCKIVTPEEMIYDSQVELVSAPGLEGDYGFMNSAAPYVSVLRMGTMTVHEDEHDQGRQFAIAGGYVEADGDKVVVLAAQALDTSTIDRDACNQELTDCKDKLAALAADDPKAAYYQRQSKWQEYLLSRLG
ncbi:MAG: ATP synthase F1 subunit epsilon [Coriobacteriales bacterium]|jgi:F-type H+-transporting ATPase subunit epsilon|nr:ATP synthase F1 subunit epsilon [Coriobacteriales bacterium]